MVMFTEQSQSIPQLFTKIVCGSVFFSVRVVILLTEAKTDYPSMPVSCQFVYSHWTHACVLFDKSLAHDKAHVNILVIRFVKFSRRATLTFNTSAMRKSNKVAKIRNRYNQVPHLTQDTNGKVTNSQKTPQTRAKRSALSQQVTTKHI